jgi:aspartyl-tRNA(Asn)/glutamyl-tRNA(Gln) amidotransferase subunit B
VSERTWEPVIGLEIHVQLCTRTKMFCGCELSFGDPPNTHTCPVCLGLPGALPVANARAVQFAVMIGLALECEIAPRSLFHRKNYFYPDLPKGYQISQYDVPICHDGRLADVRIHRAHMEEDAAKLVHVGESGRIHGSARSVVDFNRGGTPLVEIVTEPDLRSAEHAREWLTLLRGTLGALGVSDVDMSQGSLRCDANVSVRPAGATELGVKTELKNMNSFRFLQQGIEAEVERQIKLLESGEAVEQQTLHFDPASGRLSTLRTKEEAHDYRYFPEPDLVPVLVDEAMIAAARAALPELPAARAERFAVRLGLPAERARELAFRSERADYFEAALADGDGAPALALANWISLLVEQIGDADPARSRVSPEALARLVGLVEAGEVSRDAGRTVLATLAREGGDPVAIVEREGLRAISGEDEGVGAIIDAAIASDPAAGAKVRDGNDRAIGPLVGYVMRETKGRLDGGTARKLLLERLQSGG